VFFVVSFFCLSKKECTVSQTLEKRAAQRQPTHEPFAVWHPQAGRWFSARGDNISQSGILISLPLRTPLRKGQCLEISSQMNSTDHSTIDENPVRSARVVRIDRRDSITTSCIKVALNFQPNL
jgi:hypothetical protein